MFSEYELTTSSGKNLERIEYAHVVWVMYKLVTRSKDSSDLSVGFDDSDDRRKTGLINNKEAPNKGRFHLRIYLKDVLGYPEP